MKKPLLKNTSGATSKSLRAKAVSVSSGKKRGSRLMKDYVSADLKVIKLDKAYPNMIVGDTDQNSWPYLRRDITHPWYVDARSPTVGFVNRDEAMILYNSALLFRGKPCLEIGCWRGWSSGHLASGAGSLTVFDPALADPIFFDDVQGSLVRAGVGANVRLLGQASPDELAAYTKKTQIVWSLVFIDGDHDDDAPSTDAKLVDTITSPDSMVLFHDLMSPDVARGLLLLKAQGWKVRLFLTSQIMGVAWRGKVAPIKHTPDPTQKWWVPAHLAGLPISGMGANGVELRELVNQTWVPCSMVRAKQIASQLVEKSKEFLNQQAPSVPAVVEEIEKDQIIMETLDPIATTDDAIEVALSTPSSAARQTSHVTSAQSSAPDLGQSDALPEIDPQHLEKLMQSFNAVKAEASKAKAIVNDIVERFGLDTTNLSAQAVGDQLQAYVDGASSRYADLQLKYDQLVLENQSHDAERTKLANSIDVSLRELALLSQDHRSKYEIWRSEANTYKFRIEQLERNLGEERTVNAKLQADIGEANTIASNLVANVASLEEQLGHGRMALSASQLARDEAIKIAQSYEAEFGDKLNAETAKAAALQREYDAATVRIEALQAELGQAAEERLKAVDELTSQIRRASQSEEERVQAENRAQDAHAQLQNLQSEMANLHATLETERTKRQSLEAESLDVVVERDGLLIKLDTIESSTKDDIARMQNELLALGTSLDTERAKRQSLEAESLEVIVERDSLAAKIDAVQRSADAEMAALKSELETARDSLEFERTKRQSLEGEMLDVIVERDRLAKKIDDVPDVHPLVLENETLVARIEDLHKDLQKGQETINTLMNSHASERDKRAVLESDMLATILELDALRLEAAETFKREMAAVSEAERRIQSFEADLAKRGIRLDDNQVMVSQSEIKDLQNELAELKETNAQLREKAAATEKAAAKELTHAKLNALTEINALQNEINVLRQAKPAGLEVGGTNTDFTPSSDPTQAKSGANPGYNASQPPFGLEASLSASASSQAPAPAKTFLGQVKRRLKMDEAHKQIAVIRDSGSFNKDWYLTTYPDVALLGIDPITHYVLHGAAEGRDPTATFSTATYLSANPDVAASGVNALAHYISFGKAEGR